MQWVAMVTMLIDHIGAIFYPNEYFLRIIGRISFPIYVYLLVIGYYRTRSFSKYSLRLGALALISQLPYQYAFNTTTLNVIATLLVCLLMLKWLDLRKIPFFIRIIGLIASIVLLEWIPFDYGAYGLLLTLIYRYVQPHLQLVVHFVMEVSFMIYNQWAVQFISMIVTYVITFKPRFVENLNKNRAPSMLWRVFYPLHLVIFALLTYLY